MCACTGDEIKVIFRSSTVHSDNNVGKGINRPMNLTHECCWRTADEPLWCELQLETAIKLIPKHDEVLNLASRKVENVQNRADKLEWKDKQSAGKHMSMFLIIWTMKFVVFLSFVCVCVCVCCCCCFSCYCAL